jgi:hypothetical protein
MTDRELLELAAKAAGIEHYGEYNASGGLKTTGGWWNPIDGDSAAFQLAVKLKLSVWFEERESHQWTHIVWVSPVFEPYTGDVNAATRRAIVRAAAEIGRSQS